MFMKILKKDLLKLYPTLQSVANVISVTRGYIHQISEIKNPVHIRKLKRDSKRKKGEIDAAYKRIQDAEGGD